MTRTSGRKVKNVISALAEVATCALVGTLATDPHSDWYERLHKPRWQPPGAAFPIVWTALYADIALTSAAVLNYLDSQGRPKEARNYRRALALNLAANAGWSVSFFGLKQLRASVPVAAGLAASSADLARRAGRARPAYGILLAPYAVWAGFATVLNTRVAMLNPER